MKINSKEGVDGMSGSKAVASHSDADPDGVAGLDESTNHESSKISDTSGRRSGSSTRIL